MLHIYFSAEEHHVHFDETIKLKDEFESENSVTYQKTGDNVIIVHLGFLKIKHRYLIDLRLSADLFKNSAVPLSLIPDSKSDTNLHCKLVDFTTGNSTCPSNEANKLNINSRFYDIKVEYFAHKEKLLKEELKLVNSNSSEEILKLIITSRVLGKGKGTPMLRNGIHLIGAEHDESDVESDASDFQEFSDRNK